MFLPLEFFSATSIYTSISQTTRRHILEDSNIFLYISGGYC